MVKKNAGHREKGEKREIWPRVKAGEDLGEENITNNGQLSKETRLIIQPTKGRNSDAVTPYQQQSDLQLVVQKGDTNVFLGGWFFFGGGRLNAFGGGGLHWGGKWCSHGSSSLT